MTAVAALARRILSADRVHDKGLRWGARASAYQAEIRAALDAGLVPALVELAYDLPEDIGRSRVVEIDHHDKRAGEPCSLRQTFELLKRPESEWTREYALMAANDVGHMAAMRAMGASATDIRRIRDADRSAQGVTAGDEALAREAASAARPSGRVLVVESATARTSAALDFLEPEYGGPGVGDVVVIAPETVEFYGRKTVIAELSRHYPKPESWSGGALPERGFWGRNAAGKEARRLAGEILALANAG
jgi:hypothetical protein